MRKRFALLSRGGLDDGSRRHPQQQILAPCTVAQRTFSRAPAVRVSTPSTAPSSSMIPVNIYVSFHGKLVGRYRMNRHALNAYGVHATPPFDHGFAVLTAFRDPDGDNVQVMKLAQ